MIINTKCYAYGYGESIILSTVAYGYGPPMGMGMAIWL